MTTERLTFKEMCAKFDVTPRTLRYYEYIELLAPEREGRSRFFGPREIARMTLIMRGRRFGIKLEQLRQWLLIYEEEGSDAQMAAFVEMADEQLKNLYEQQEQLAEAIQELKDLRFDLAEVVGVELGKRAEAVETGRRILDIEPHSADELLRLAAIFEHNQAHEELAGVLEALTARDGVREALLVSTCNRVELLYVEDGADNDLDGAFDCDDDQCAPSPVCQGATGCDCAGSVNPLETRPDAFALLLLWIVFLLKSRRAPPIMGQRRLPIHERRRKAVPRA